MSAFAAADRFLRGEAEFAVAERHLPGRQLVAAIVAGGLVYGAAMGTYGVHALQSLYSAVKVPMLLLWTTLVCLPNFYALNAVLGLRDDFTQACRGILAAMAAQSLALASLAPVILVIYLSEPPMESIAFWNGGLFAIATAAGHVVLRRYYRPLIAKNPLHRRALTAWLTLFVFVAVQLAWVLRPFLGTPGYPVTFLREDPWSNAYVVLFDLIARMFG